MEKVLDRDDQIAMAELFRRLAEHLRHPYKMTFEEKKELASLLDEGAQEWDPK